MSILKSRFTLAAFAVVLAPAQAADVAAGKASAESKCIACHAADDWQGEDATALESLIRDIVADKVNHKQKLELSSAEIANIAAYWAETSR